MRRFLLVLLLACPVLVAAIAAIGGVTWALVALGLNGLASPWLVLGLSASVPLSIAAADRLVPGSPARALPVGLCLECGAPLGAGPVSKPDPSWEL